MARLSWPFSSFASVTQFGNNSASFSMLPAMISGVCNFSFSIAQASKLFQRFEFMLERTQGGICFDAAVELFFVFEPGFQEHTFHFLNLDHLETGDVVANSFARSRRHRHVVAK